MDFSTPQGFSINDGISPSLCSLEYVSVDQAACLVAACGRGVLMAKTDLHNAYRHVPVHPSDQHLLGIEWSGQLYYDRALPFGLCSAPKLFLAVTDGLAWALNCTGVTDTVHYLDDFLLWGPPDSLCCAIALQMTTEICMHLGLPKAHDKCRPFNDHHLSGHRVGLGGSGVEIAINQAPAPSQLPGRV